MATPAPFPTSTAIPLRFRKDMPMQPDREQPPAELERLRTRDREAEGRSGKADNGSATIRQQCDVDKLLLAVFAAVIADTKAAESPGWLREAIMFDGREHPQGAPGTDRHRWFAAKLLVAAYVTIETPLFVDSKLTRMVQIADLCAYALRRYLENGETGLFQPIFARADRIGDTAVGVRHFSPLACDCAICRAHQP